MLASFHISDDELFTHFSNTFFSQELPSIQLGRAIFQFDSLVIGNTENQVWERKYNICRPHRINKAETEIRLKFHSPTAFRALTPRGQRTYSHTQVDPVRCYQSWIN